MTTPRTVDTHAHFVPPRVLEELARHPGRYGAGDDTITHWALPLRYLAEVAGADRIMLGSDYPFDVGDPDPVASVKAARLPDSAEVAILGATARTLFGGASPAAP